MKIRALTLFIDPEVVKFDLKQLASTIGDLVDDAQRNFGIEIWTKRLALTPQPIKRMTELAENLEIEIPDVIDYISIPIILRSVDDMTRIFEVLSKCKRIFTSICGSEDQLIAFQKLLEIILNKQNPECFIKVSFSIKNHILTPYFPAASAPNGKIGFSGALLYVSDLMNALNNKAPLAQEIENCFNMAMRILDYLAKKLNVENFGVDLSISPWMDDSVAKLLEMISGEEFNKPSTFYAVMKLNDEIKYVSSKCNNCIGFNEIMLPYAEDSRLMELGGKGKLTAYDLLLLSSVCVAGLDVVVLPKMDRKVLRNFLLDAYAILSSKGKPSGIRVILTDKDPGEIAELGFLGSAPVMKLK
ncbi:MAG: hypothetical protein DRJ26_05145 [Candidatus Methanomethylicota archaeon]|uniref:DUF711 family protein n=1 Tax=Thermoproteota archaeon TaxID=2056631 RepID=A0A497EZF9_9CREN|nr:MAG: hypothetical protein DRJ26_05145 [Candidatus Verstraetearchaeota archaeon]